MLRQTRRGGALARWRAALVWCVALVCVCWCVACSDTECREKIGPDGELVESDQCLTEGGTTSANAGTSTNNSTTSANNNTNTQTSTNNGTTSANNADAGGTNNGTTSANNADAGGGDDVAPDVPAPTQSLVGDWVSQGEDIAPLLQEGGFDIDRVVVSFDRNDRYEGEIILRSGDAFPFAGTYSTNVRSTPPSAIVLSQQEPNALVSQGIFAVEQGGAVLRYEVVQVEPPTPGFQPPTPERGFGSTVGVQDEADNIQVYRRVE